jgi:hypothetical protein
MEIESSDFPHFHRDTHFFSKKGKTFHLFVLMDQALTLPQTPSIDSFKKHVHVFVYKTIFAWGDRGRTATTHFPPFESVFGVEEKYSSNSMCSRTGS